MLGEATPRFVSCILATKDRLEFLSQALRCFLAQTHTNSELIVIDDGKRSARELCRNLPRVRYIRLTRAESTGVKLNIGIEEARGDLLQKMDDDDYYHPDFLRLAVSRHPSKVARRTVVAWCCFLVCLRGEQSLRRSGHGWKAGGTLSFHRELWKRRPFRDVPTSEDSWFLQDHKPRILRVCAEEHYIVVRHGRNTWNEMWGGSNVDDYFRDLPRCAKPLRELVSGDSLPFYLKLTGV